MNESEDIIKKGYFQNFSWFQLHVLLDLVYIGIAP